jgi:aspartyl-tRNA(Asn)/glutamyl-tRNA(Gln) amidotransferase subunit A
LEGIFLGRPDSPGEGIRLAVKDLFDTAGLETTYGSAIFAGHVPTRTAAAVEALEAAGYVNVGKANLHEFAYGTTSENPHYGTVPNPVGPGRIAGGSSGGNAAALALGLADVALGTDSGGSIRIPAACCGTVGFKPTYGLVSLDGCWPLAATYDHAGPMARDVENCTAMLGVLAPRFERLSLETLEELRLGVAWTEHAQPLVRERVEAVAARFPDRRRIDLPLWEGPAHVFAREVADVHRELYAENSGAYGEDVAIKVEACLRVTDAQVEQAQQQRERYRERVEEAFEGIDLLLTPTLACVAPPIGAGGTGDLDIRETMIAFTLPFNTVGWPALALPCGPAEDGLPASAQLVGRAGEDALVLAAGSLLYPV